MLEVPNFKPFQTKALTWPGQVLYTAWGLRSYLHSIARLRLDLRTPVARSRFDLRPPNVPLVSGGAKF